MKIVLITLFVIFNISCSNIEKKIDCEQFKDGKFYLKGRHSNEEYIIERNGYIQTETTKRTGNIVSMSVKWVNPCTYELIFKELIRNDTIAADGKKVIIKIKDDSPVSTSILKVAKNYYVFGIGKSGYNYEYSDTMWIIK